MRQHHRTVARQGATVRRLHARGTEAPDEADLAEARLAAQAQWPLVRAALDDLRPEDRELVLLVSWEELTYEQAAAALDIPLGTVRSRLSRARRQLRHAVDPGTHEPAPYTPTAAAPSAGPQGRTER